MAVTAQTPIDLVNSVYATLPDRVAIGRRRLGRPLTLAEKILVNHLRDPEAQDLQRGHSYADFHPDRVAMQDATAQMALLQFMTAGLDDCRSADDGALRPPHPGEGGRGHRPEDRPHDERRGLRLPPHRVGSLRHRLLEAGLGDHPPGRARELRLPRRDDDRHRQPHAQRGRPRDDRDRRRRCRCGRRDDGLPVQRAVAEAHRRAPHGRALGMVVAEGRDPEGRRGAHRRGRHGRDRRVLRPWRRHDQRDRQGHDLQHGRRDRRDHLALRLRPEHGRVPQGHRPRGDRRRGERGRRATCGPTPRSSPTRAASSTEWSRSTSTRSSR